MFYVILLNSCDPLDTRKMSRERRAIIKKEHEFKDVVLNIDLKKSYDELDNKFISETDFDILMRFLSLSDFSTPCHAKVEKQKTRKGEKFVLELKTGVNESIREIFNKIYNGILVGSVELAFHKGEFISKPQKFIFNKKHHLEKLETLSEAELKATLKALDNYLVFKKYVLKDDYTLDVYLVLRYKNKSANLLVGSFKC